MFDLEKLTCGGGDKNLFDYFLEMIIETKGSANEIPANVLASIFICRTELVENRLKEKYKDRFLIELLEFGFKNINNKNKVENYLNLEKRLSDLKQ